MRKHLFSFLNEEANYSVSNETDLTTGKELWSNFKKMQKRHPSLFLKQDSVFDADLEASLVDFVLVYETKKKKKKEKDTNTMQENGDENKSKEKFKDKDKKREYRTNYLNNLLTNGLKFETRVCLKFFFFHAYPS